MNILAIVAGIPVLPFIGIYLMATNKIPVGTND